MAQEPEFVLRWGGRRRTHRGKARDDTSLNRSDGLKHTSSCYTGRRMSGENEASPLPPTKPRQLSLLHARNSDLTGTDNHSNKDRYYPTRNSAVIFEENGSTTHAMLSIDEKGPFVLPRFFISLSNKEKEEDFMAMKGCRLPQRPKKRSKSVQKCLLAVSPGAWLSDLCHERYEVREKKASRKRIRGLKAMCVESDSE